MMFFKAIFLSLPCFFFSVCAAVIDFNDDSTFDLKKYSTTIGKDFKSFKNWILNPSPPEQKQELIQNTILNVHYPMAQTIDWAVAQMSNTDFDSLIESRLDDLFFTVTAVQGFYSYSPNNVFWVDFANASTFGGGFRSKGNVQEERMFMEFPQLPQLAYAKKSHQIQPVASSCKLPLEQPYCAKPFFIFDVLRRFDISKVPYGKALYDVKPSQIPKYIERLSKPNSMANIIGLAAPDWCDKKNSQKKYTLSVLKYLLKEALLGNLGALKYNLQQNRGSPEIHSGGWGTGAFKNSIDMVTAIQILAAAMAQIKNRGTVYGIRLFLHGISAKLASQLQEDIVNQLQQGRTPLQLLNYFLDLQSTDPTLWGPQQC